MADTQGHNEPLPGTGSGDPISPEEPVVPTGATPTPAGTSVPPSAGTPDPTSAGTPGPIPAAPPDPAPGRTPESTFDGTPEPIIDATPAPSAGTTSDLDQPGGGRSVPPTPDPVVDLVHRIESSEGLDRPAAVLEKVANSVAPEGPVHDALIGKWLGHALHPLMTDFPLGMWLSASLLDFVGGKASRKASRRLVGLGVLAAVPTAATGMAEWLHVDQPSRRVGVVHANSNSVGLMLYTASYLARRRGQHFRGTILGVGGGLAAIFGGYLGGHLSLARKAGTRDDRFAQPAESNGSESGVGA